MTAATPRWPSQSPAHRSAHLLMVPFASRSHLRLHLTFTLNLLDLHQALQASILITRGLRALVQAELRRHPGYIARAGEDRIRVLEVGKDDRVQGSGMFREAEVLIRGFAQAWARLAGRGGFVDQGESTPGHPAGHDKEQVPWGPPDTVMYDMFLPQIREILRLSPDGEAIPALLFMPTLASAMSRFVAPEGEGGMGIGMVSRYKTLLNAGAADEDACRRAYRFAREGGVLRYKDLPEMYDYEWTPQSEARGIDSSVVNNIAALHETFRLPEAIISFGLAELEGDALRWMEEVTGRPVLGVGPQLPATAWVPLQHTLGVTEPVEGGEVMPILDEWYSRYGANSTAYISFGTVFWPDRRPEIMETLVESLLTIEPPLPFIWALTPTNGHIDRDLVDRIHQSGRGKVLAWVPQLDVLRHPAVGIFLTHCGFGSVSEAIVAEVPIIALPISGDQPPLAAHFTKIQQIGIQLFQPITATAYPLTLRSGLKVHGTKAAMLAEMLEAWHTMRGLRAEGYRQRISEVKDLIRESASSGSALHSMLTLGEYWSGT
ncbi:hypothetical protein IAU60_005251 [Kwoniella sp. DSM 27419]